ncbi:IS3 family transposase, partial [Escherichia coli]|nr:IS3 family transposase [Escherichia coli]
YRSVEELENAVNEYITYWNQKRIKLSLGGLSPVELRIFMKGDHSITSIEIG